MRRSLLAAAATAALAACGDQSQGPATQQASETPTSPLTTGEAPAGIEPLRAAVIAVAMKEPIGRYLVDGEGRSLYVLEGDRADSTRCTVECLGQWPPVLTSGAPTAAEGVDSAKLETTARDNGQQVTYAGWPLYYYVGDEDPASTSGHHMRDRWGEWYLLSPGGEMIQRGR